MNIAPPEAEHGADVSTQLRQLRESRGLSLRALATLAGVTPAALSQIENGKNSPSVSTLKKVLSALGTTLGEFFSAQERPGDGESFVYRSGQLVDLSTGQGLKFLGLPGPAPGRALQVLFETYAPGADTGAEPYAHPGEEAGFCVAGTVEVTVNGRREILGPGDGYYYASTLPHRWRNIGNVPARVISVCTPPTF
ncbi:MAG: cupin domain-containing protein [Planctomycetes bacterium]|nr:cupin domain-containing protein [Planctomycetota bacterium]